MCTYYHLFIWLSEAVEGPGKGDDGDEIEVVPSKAEVLDVTVEKKPIRSASSLKMTSRYEEIMKTKPYLPFKMGFLTEHMKVKAEKELGETEEVKIKCLQELRNMLEKETNLVCPTDDAYLLQYLRARKYDVKRAFSLMQGYYKVKKSFAYIYDSYSPDIMKKVFSQKILMPLLYRDEDGCVVYLIKISNWDPDEFPMNIGLQAITGSFLHCIEDPATQVCGLRILIDVRGCSFKHLRCMTPTYIHLLSRGLRNTLPIRFKSIHIFNETFLIQYLWPVFKIFLTMKIIKRVHFHGGEQKNLHKSIPKAILPVEYGGDNPHDIADWYYGEALKYFERGTELTTYGYRD